MITGNNIKGVGDLKAFHLKSIFAVAFKGTNIKKNFKKTFKFWITQENKKKCSCF